MIEAALLFFLAAALIFLSLAGMSGLRKGKTYGAGKWPQPITEAPKMPKNTEGWDG
jgi:hypothetical protein